MGIEKNPPPGSLHYYMTSKTLHYLRCVLVCAMQQYVIVTQRRDYYSSQARHHGGRVCESHCISYILVTETGTTFVHHTSRGWTDVCVSFPLPTLRGRFNYSQSLHFRVAHGHLTRGGTTILLTCFLPPSFLPYFT